MVLLRTTAWEITLKNCSEERKEKLVYMCVCVCFWLRNTCSQKYCCSVDKSCLTLQPHELQDTRLSCPSLSPWVCSNSCPLRPRCHPTISSSVIPFSSFLQSSPASGTFAVSQFFASGGQSIGASASASASVFPMNIQDWSPLGLTGLISLLFKGLSRVLSSTTVQKHQFFSTQPPSWSNSHIHT